MSLFNLRAPAASAESAQASSSSETSEINRFAEVCERAADGDLEARITDVDPESDLGRLARAVNHLLDMADAFVREASAAMQQCSADRFHRPILLRGLHGAYRKSAGLINEAGLKMKKNSEQLRMVGGLASETAARVQTVAAACEELNASSSEISRQAMDSVTLVETTVDQAAHAAKSVAGLQSAAAKIDEILSLINSIASQTNLLALNASIEAARAGVHGRGFAVVANEVKELSRSSSQATEDVDTHLQAMKATVKDVGACITTITSSIHKVQESARVITDSVGQQVQATADISRNITEVSESTLSVSRQISSQA